MYHSHFQLSSNTVSIPYRNIPFIHSNVHVKITAFSLFGLPDIFGLFGLFGLLRLFEPLGLFGLLGLLGFFVPLGLFGHFGLFGLLRINVLSQSFWRVVQGSICRFHCRRGMVRFFFFISSEYSFM